MRRAALFLVVALTTITSATAQPSGAAKGKEIAPAAKARFERGLALFGKKEYEAAIAEFNAAFQLDERPEILFALAQAERLSGDCVSALVFYRRFVETGPPAKHAALADEAIGRCERALSSRPVGAPEPAPSAEPPATETAPPPSALAAEPAPVTRRDSMARPNPWYRDTLGVSLAGAGVVSLAVGTTFYLFSRSNVADAEDADTYQAHVDALDVAERNRAIGWVGLGVGTALVTGAVLRFALRDHGGESSRQLAMTAGSDSVTAWLAGRF